MFYQGFLNVWFHTLIVKISSLSNVQNIELDLTCSIVVLDTKVVPITVPKCVRVTSQKTVILVTFYSDNVIEITALKVGWKRIFFFGLRIIFLLFYCYRLGNILPLFDHIIRTISPTIFPTIIVSLIDLHRVFKMYVLVNHSVYITFLYQLHDTSTLRVRKLER